MDLKQKVMATIKSIQRMRARAKQKARKGGNRPNSRQRKSIAGVSSLARPCGMNIKGTKAQRAKRLKELGWTRLHYCGERGYFYGIKRKIA